MQSLSKRVAERIIYFRKLKKLSQEQLGIESSLHRAYIGQVERHEKVIGLNNLERVAAALDVSIVDLVKE